MAQSSMESVLETPMTEISVSFPNGATAPPTPIKLKGKKRLLHTIQRISSSPSLVKLGRTPSSGYRTGGKASVSCISLSSSSPSYGPGYALANELSAGYYTAPTSTATTPGIQIPYFDERARIRYLGDGKNSVGLPSEVRPTSKLGMTPGIAEESDYFSISISKPLQTRPDFNFWHDLPSELRMEVLSYLEPRQIIRCSAVSKSWHKMCFDGQLWAVLDTSDFYRDIPANALVKIITSAGPFVKDLNLRGCVQLREKWHSQALFDACRNLESFSLEGCRIDRTSIHTFLIQNTRLLHLNLSGLAGATNTAMKYIAQHCLRLEYLNVSWCNNVDSRGLRRVIESCSQLKDLRAGEVRGWDDVDFMQAIFKRNTLERLVLMNCDSLTDESLAVLMEGKDSEIDWLTSRPIVPPRNLKHLDLTRCRNISDQGIMTLVNNTPNLEGLQLSKCHGITDASLTDLLPTLPALTHLDLEELEDLTNATLQCLATSPCRSTLRHLSISYCENLGDTGMLPVLKSCTRLQSLDMDNTRISDLVLAEAAAMVRARSPRTSDPRQKPTVGLRLVAYDCQNVTWTGVREVLSRNAEVVLRRPQALSSHPLEPSASAAATTATTATSTTSAPAPTVIPDKEKFYPTALIALKCFYTYQPTVDEHTKRCLSANWAAALRLERKWAGFMIAQEEAGVGGAGSRRRRRRAREAAMMHADEEDREGEGRGEGGVGGVGVGGGRRRRARSGGCVVM
ncbi:hypothetical protein M8818_003713 [Zalaria obscura]|uniref:Uncharacterized protein n=1 Tax=Zalaria obscura TaxID=2024903 RepID=A0ACC3SIH7_9PEZI